MEKPILIGFIFKTNQQKGNKFLQITRFNEKVRILTISEKSDLATHSAYHAFMLAATHLMFVKDQKGGLMCPQGAPLPLFMKKL